MNNVIGFPMILISWIVVYTLDSVIHCSNNAVPEPGGGKRQGLGLRNDVLITCKAVTLHCGQRIIAVFSQSRYFRSEKWASRGNNSIVEKKISWLFDFLAYRICRLVLKLQNASDGHCKRIIILNRKQSALDYRSSL